MKNIVALIVGLLILAGCGGSGAGTSSNSTGGSGGTGGTGNTAIQFDDWTANLPLNAPSSTGIVGAKVGADPTSIWIEDATVGPDGVSTPGWKQLDETWDGWNNVDAAGFNNWRAASAMASDFHELPATPDASTTWRAIDGSSNSTVIDSTPTHEAVGTSSAAGGASHPTVWKSPSQPIDAADLKMGITTLRRVVSAPNGHKYLIYTSASGANLSVRRIL